MSEATDEALSRRRLLAGAGAVVAAAAVSAACGTSEDPAATSSSPDAPGSSGPAGGSPGDAVAALADVPVGGGVILPDRKIVLTQPAAGDVRAFTAVCTHQGCLVSVVADNVITCRCHNSEFSAEDGAVIQGPAVNGLAPVGVSVSGDQITLA